MISLLKMDVRRIFKSKSIYVGAVFCLLLTLFVISFIYLAQNPNQVSNINDNNSSVQIESMSGESLQMNTVEVFYNIITPMGLFALLLMILNSIFIGSDFESGFIKNIFTYRAGRIQYLLSKWIVMQLVSFIYLLLIIGSIYFYKNNDIVTLTSVSTKEVLVMLLFGMVYSGVSLALSSAVAVLFKNKSINIAASFILSCGWLVQAVNGVMGVLKIDGNIGKRFILDYTIYGAKNAIFDFSSPKGAQFAILVCTAWLVIWMLSSCIILKKRDIS